MALTTAQIIEGIQKYTSIVFDGAALVTAYEQGNAVFYKLPSNLGSSDSIHLYPCLYNDVLYFYMIPNEYDNEDYKDRLDEVGAAEQVIWKLDGTHTITKKEADFRMNNWGDNYKTWLPKEAATTQGVFKAFKLDIIDFELPEDNAQLTLGLKAVGVDDNKADMIIANYDASANVTSYDDFTSPIPPHGAADFYLLTL